MIGLVLPGSPAAEYKLSFNTVEVISVFNPILVNSLTLYLLEAIPNDACVSIYFSLPPFENVQFIGCVANDRPSFFFNKRHIPNQLENNDRDGWLHWVKARPQIRTSRWRSYFVKCGRKEKSLLWLQRQNSGAPCKLYRLIQFSFCLTRKKTRKQICLQSPKMQSTYGLTNLTKNT